MNHSFLKKLQTVSLVILLALLLLPLDSVRAGDFTSTGAGGSWSAGATWDIGTAPTAADNATIANGTTVTISANTTINNLTIASGGALIVTGVKLTITGNFTNSGTLTTVSGSNIEFSGGVDQTIGEFTSSGPLIVNKSGGTVTFSGDVTVTNFTMTSGTATFNGNVNGAALTTTNGTLNLDNGSALTHTFTGTWTYTGGIVNLNKSTLILQGAVPENTGAKTTLNTGAGTVEYGRAGDQYIVPVNYYNLVTSGGGAKRLQADTTINTLTVGAGTTLNTNTAFVLSVTGETTVSGTLEFRNDTPMTHILNGLVTIKPTGKWYNSQNKASFIFKNGLKNEGSGGTSNFAPGTSGVYTFSTNNQDITGTFTTAIPNLEVTGITLTNKGTFTANTLTVNSGATLLNQSTITLNTTLAGEGSFTQDENSNLYMLMSSASFPGFFTASATGNTVYYNKNSSQTVLPTSPANPADNGYYDLVLDGTSTSYVKTLTTDITINNTLFMQGAVTASGTPTYGDNAALQYTKSSISDNFTVGNEWPATFNGTGGVIIDDTFGKNANLNENKIVSKLTVNNAGRLYTGLDKNTNYNLTVTGDVINDGVLYVWDSQVQIGGDFVNTGGTFYTPNAAQVTITGNFTNDGGRIANSTSSPAATYTLNGDFSNVGGTFDASTSLHINLTSTADQSIDGFTTTGTVSMLKSGGTATFAGNVSAGGLNINGNGGTLKLDDGAGSLNHTFSGIWVQSAGTLNASQSTLNLRSTDATTGGTNHTGGTFIPGTGTVNYQGAGTQKIAALTYYNLSTGAYIGTTTRTKNTAGNIQVQHDLVVGLYSILSVGSSTAAHNLTVDGDTLVTGQLTFNNVGGTKTYDGMVTVNGTWTNSINSPITFHGGLTNNGTFTSGTGIYTFNTNPQTIGGTKSTSIAKINVNGVTLTNNINDGVAPNTSTLTATTELSGTGALEQGENSILIIEGTSLISGLDADNVVNTVKYGGGAQTVKATPYHHLELYGTGAKTLTGVTTILGNLTLTFGDSTTTATTAADLTIGGNLVITKGTLTVGAFDIIVNGTTTVSGSLTHSADIGGIKRYINTVTVGGTWNNSGNADITLRNGLIFNSGTFTSGSGVYTFDTTANQVIDGASLTITNLAIANGVTLTNNVGTRISSNTSTLTVSGLTGAGTFRQGLYSILNFSGVNMGIATLDTSTNTPNTVIYNKAGAQTINPNADYYHLTLSKGGAKDMTGVTTIKGNLTLSDSTTAASLSTNLTIGDTLTTASGTTFTVNAPASVTVGKELTGTAAVTQGAPTVEGIGTLFNTEIKAGQKIYIGGVGYTISTITDDDTLTLTANYAGTNASGIKLYTGSATLGGTWNNPSTTENHFLGGLLTINGTWNNSGSADIHLQGGLKVGSASTFTSGSGTYMFETNDQTLDADKNTEFTNIQVNGIKLVNNTVGVALFVKGSLSGTGEFEQGVEARLYPTMQNVETGISVATLDLTSNENTVNYYTGGQNIKPATYHHLILSGSGAMIPPDSGLSTINGNLILYLTTSLTLKQDLVVKGSVSIAGPSATDCALNIGNFNLNVGGNWTKSIGKFTFSPAATGVVTFDGAGTQYIQGTTATTFQNVTIAKPSGGVTLATVSPIINGELNLTDGVITTGTLAVTLGKDAQITNGDTNSYIYGNVKKFFAAPQMWNFKFALGDAAGYRPMELYNFNVTGPATGAGYITAAIPATPTEHASIATSGINKDKNVNRYWTITPGGGLAATGYNARFGFRTAHYDLDSNPDLFIVRRYQAKAWTYPTIGARDTVSDPMTVEATGFTVLTTANFVVGEPAPSAISEVSIINAPYGNNVTLSAKLMSGTTLITGKPIEFFLNNVSVGTVNTVNGVATLAVTLSDNAGFYDNGVRAEFAGDNMYASSSGSADLTINKRPVTVTAITETKPFDGDDTSSKTPTITSGSLVGSDSESWSQTFDNETIAANKTITPAGSIDDGNSGNNYQITFAPVTTGEITKKELTVSGIDAIDKTYDRNDNAAISGTAALNGLVTGYDSVNLVGGSITGKFNNRHVAYDAGGVTVIDKPVTLFGDLEGTHKDYYILTLDASATAKILPAPIELTAVSDTKGYDGTTSSDETPTINSGSLKGTIAPDLDTVSQAFETSAAGTGKTLIPTVNDGNNGKNYDITAHNDTTGVISKAALTITADNVDAYRGEPRPNFPYTVTGFAGGDSFLSPGFTAPTCASATADMNVVDSYDIVCTGGTASDNYATPFTYVNGILNIVEPFEVTYTSIGAYDGWVLSSSPENLLGDLFNSSAYTFNVGDNAINRQYRSLLHFNTSSLPDDALGVPVVIATATLKIKNAGGTGRNPFLTHGSLFANMSDSYYFGATNTLKADDFAAAGLDSIAGAFGRTPLNSWYTAQLTNTAKVEINKDGTTQFKLRFSKATDRDYVADYLAFFSGNYRTAAYRPQLIIEYYCRGVTDPNTQCQLTP